MVLQKPVLPHTALLAPDIVELLLQLEKLVKQNISVVENNKSHSFIALYKLSSLLNLI